MSGMEVNEDTSVVPAFLAALQQVTGAVARDTLISLVQDMGGNSSAASRVMRQVNPAHTRGKISVRGCQQLRQHLTSIGATGQTNQMIRG